MGVCPGRGAALRAVPRPGYELEFAARPHSPFIPAQAGIQYWVPAFAGTNGFCRFASINRGPGSGARTCAPRCARDTSPRTRHLMACLEGSCGHTPSFSRRACRARALPGGPRFNGGPGGVDPRKMRGGRRAEEAQPVRLCTRVFSDLRGASRRAVAAISVPGAVLPGADGARAGPPIRAAFAALRPRRVQPLKAGPRSRAGRLPGASRAHALRGHARGRRPDPTTRRNRFAPLRGSGAGSLSPPKGGGDKFSRKCDYGPRLGGKRLPSCHPGQGDATFSLPLSP